MDNDKRGIGNNSTEGKYTSLLFEKEAVREMMQEIKGFAKETEDYIYKMYDAIKQVLSTTAPLTDKQENWNFNVDKYNDLIMEQNPNPATNKKHLRKKYKPKKLSANEIRDKLQSIQDDLNFMIDSALSITATVNAYQDPSNFKDWIDAARQGGKSDE